jgi:hypothetical protein
MVRFTFSGHELVALPQGALFWPARKALLVADLHLEKASWFARFGQMLPPYDSIATLADLTALSASTGAEEIWCLGDSFHDTKGCDRLPAKARELLSALTGAVRWTWITGNHDPGIADHCGGDRGRSLVDGLLLRHEADPAEPRPPPHRRWGGGPCEAWWRGVTGPPPHPLREASPLPLHHPSGGPPPQGVAGRKCGRRHRMPARLLCDP